ncbi:Coagulation factor VIII [Oryzias melastigma]|uniref:Coagulation factor VIII n=1 Tax=Oryzias melastigma TaxID=30732 RepID=A0A834BX46_ORYME|nr:Coagulation factor VIII [Oryzias melastigma]
MSRTLLFPLLLLLLLCGSSAGEPQTPVAVEEYYIAAVEIGWDYIHLDDASEQRVKAVPQKYIKAVYREYTDSTYTIPKERPAWAGIQGPTIVTQAGHRVVVHFKNLASQPYSISPVGITYWKQSEGAGYDDSTAGQEKEDDAVSPGGQYEYVWDINPKDGPTVSDPECLTYSYSSQVDTVRDTNSGLMGALLICKSSAFTEDGRRRYPAFVLLLAVFDETQSWYGERMSREMFKMSEGRKVYHTINGYVNSTLPGLTMCHNHHIVFWHLIGMSTAPEIHSIHFQDHSLQVMAHRKVNLEITSMSFITAEMRPTSPGRFLISCQIHSHRYDGMNAEFNVEKCPEPEVRNVKMDSEEMSYEDYASMFNTVNIPKPPFQVRSSREQSRTWKHFIAAEEIPWDYTPHLKPTDSLLQSRYLPAPPHHLGYKYKKVAFVEYTDASFTRRKNLQQTLLGPVLKGKVNDEIHIVFKNMASRPFNIYPSGLTKILPLQRSSNAAENNLRSMGVLPNETFGYIWRLTTDDGPLKGDPQCLTQLYQSTFSPESDLASGLVGTLLICKYDAIDTRGRLLGPDEKQSLIFAVFDENKSWYFKENMMRSSQSSYNTTEPGFYESNVIYSINGIMFRGRQFVVCQTDVVFWHVANVGTRSDFLSVYFTGNLFHRQSLYQSVLTLFPMTAETIPMETELTGEWEISAFDSSLKNKGMSIRYTVLPCNNRDVSLYDYNIDENLSDYLDEILPQPRGLRPQNGTALIRVCKRPLANNQSNPLNMNRTEDTGKNCELRRVPMALLEKIKSPEQEEIPEDILGKLDREGVWNAHQNQSETGVKRRRRQAERNWTETDTSFEALGDNGTALDFVGENINSTANITADIEETALEIVEEGAENLTDINSEVKTKELSVSLREKNKTVKLEEDNDFTLSPEVQRSSEVLAENINQNWELLSQISGESDWLTDDMLELYNNISDANTTQLGFSLEYDDYIDGGHSTADAFGGVNPRSGEKRPRLYYIAAEEITWDYGIRTPHQFIKRRQMQRGMRKFLPEYKKVVFRAYMDDKFQHPIGRGELQEHLGIMGPFIGAEINELLTVVFKNKASRPYSFHLHGVYDGNQGSGLGQAGSKDAPVGIPGEPVSPGEIRTYNWKINKKQGPTDSEFNCKTGAYYSTVDKERDLHSGLIGPLVICKVGTLEIHLHTKPTVLDFSLLFHAFDETKSWYLQENLQKYCTPPCEASTDDPWYHTSNTFAAINGYVAETLPGLMVAQHQQVRWHLLNVGGDKEFHAVHFHGLPFTVHTKQEHRMGVFNLFPGVFGTVEMTPSTVGTWLVECTIGDYQLAGMRAKLLVYDPYCSIPLGMKSGWIKDSQITASDHEGNWEPRLARLEKSGYINAWMGRSIKSWIQIDLQRPTLLHGIETQGVRSSLRDHYITFFNISYSLDQRTWTDYREYNSKISTNFPGNLDSSTVRQNSFFPPFVARYVRIQPFRFKRKPALRLELLGCDVNSCSLPLGLKNKIPDSNFTASSSYSSLMRSWSPSLARLHQTGGANAWRPKNNNPHEWLQVDLGSVKRITGVITQGARSVLTEMMVTEFSVTYSQDEHTWSSVLEDNSQREKIFTGNSDVDEEALNFFDPPLFGRYVRIHPRGWINDIALRLELLGCVTQPGV